MPNTSKDTKPELLLRRALWRRGIRYRLHNRKLPGTPDISIMKYRVEEDLLEMGYSVIRIWDTDVVKDPEKAADEVEQAVRYKARRKKRDARS